MQEPAFFPGCPQRCLFRNEDVEAHLIGLGQGRKEVSGCFSCPATLLVTFGSASVWWRDQVWHLGCGQQCELPARCPLRLQAAEADVLLLVRRHQAHSRARHGLRD